MTKHISAIANISIGTAAAVFIALTSCLPAHARSQMKIWVHDFYNEKKGIPAALKLIRVENKVVVDLGMTDAITGIREVAIVCAEGDKIEVEPRNNNYHKPYDSYGCTKSPVKVGLVSKYVLTSLILESQQAESKGSFQEASKGYAIALTFVDDPALRQAYWTAAAKSHKIPLNEALTFDSSGKFLGPTTKTMASEFRSTTKSADFKWKVFCKECDSLREPESLQGMKSTFVFKESLFANPSNVAPSEINRDRTAEIIVNRAKWRSFGLADEVKKGGPTIYCQLSKELCELAPESLY